MKVFAHFATEPGWTLLPGRRAAPNLVQAVTLILPVENVLIVANTNGISTFIAQNATPTNTYNYIIQRYIEIMDGFIYSICHLLFRQSISFTYNFLEGRRGRFILCFEKNSYLCTQLQTYPPDEFFYCRQS